MHGDNGSTLIEPIAFIYVLYIYVRWDMVFTSSFARQFEYIEIQCVLLQNAESVYTKMVISSKNLLIFLHIVCVRACVCAFVQ